MQAYGKIKTLRQVDKAMRFQIRKQRDRIKILEKYCLKLHDKYKKDFNRVRDMIGHMIDEKHK